MITKEFIRLPIDEIKPYKRNPRINDQAVNDVLESVKLCGELDPVEIDERNVVLSGHTRLKAYIKLGLKEVDCVRFTGLTSEQKKMYRVLANKTGEKALWDFKLLEGEIKGLDFGGYDFGLTLPKAHEWFDREEKEGAAREEGNDEYNEFLEKFEPKKTTDDCYTPQNIYDVVATWVSDEYGVQPESFVRPFYPGGDYRRFEYAKGAVVVDNPPFSILAEIIDFYVENGIKFFLFAPGLATLNYVGRRNVCAICTYVGVTYENGAIVTTSFLTNLGSGEFVAIASHELFKLIDEANKENEAKLRKHFPKYEFPNEVLTSAKCGWLAKYGQSLKIRRAECVMIRQLDSMKEVDKGIFGNALLLSEKAAAEKAAAETWQLSEREKAIVKSLGEGVKENGKRETAEGNRPARV